VAKFITAITPETTNQQLFDYVTSFVLHQGRPSVTGAGGVCAYRGSEGTMCAIGCVMPKNIYKPSLEGKMIPDFWHIIEDLDGRKPRTLLQRWVTDIQRFFLLLEDLQEIHDVDAYNTLLEFRQSHEGKNLSPGEVEKAWIAANRKRWSDAFAKRASHLGVKFKPNLWKQFGAQFNLQEG
jgi:hypothetical protein